MSRAGRWFEHCSFADTQMTAGMMWGYQFMNVCSTGLLRSHSLTRNELSTLKYQGMQGKFYSSLLRMS